MSESSDTKSFRIEYRHLAFLFLGAVCTWAVFFALGFVVGRAQTFETALKDSEELKNTAEGVLEASSAARDVPSASGKEDAPLMSELSGKADDTNTGTLAVDYRKDLDFYTAVKEPKVDQNFHPESPKPDKTAVSARKPSTKSEGRTTTSSMRNSESRAGAVSLQVAALKSSTEADRLAKALRSKGYPVFIVNPAPGDSSKLIRVQIGPYTNDAEAAKVKARLSTDGYAAISKR